MSISPPKDDDPYFSDGTTSTDLFGASEDPKGQGTGKNETPDFMHHRELHPTRHKKPTSLVHGIVNNLTPGARHIP